MDSAWPTTATGPWTLTYTLRNAVQVRKAESVLSKVSQPLFYAKICSARALHATDPLGESNDQVLRYRYAVICPSLSIQ